MKVGIVGGGINGLSCAWLLAQAGHEVHLYERGKLAKETTSASSKLLHGGVRYLEQFEFRLVREALKERDTWLHRVPELTNPLRLVMPIYSHSKRSRWLVGLGLFLYDHLAGRSHLPPAKWLSAKKLLNCNPQLRAEGLVGGYEFSDAQMDDYKLALWVADQAQQLGVQINENKNVTRIDLSGNVFVDNNRLEHDCVINVCGPWTVKLLESSDIPSLYRLDTVRGSHLILEKKCEQALLLEIPNEKRIFFVLPWQGNTLLGTTETRQEPEFSVACSDEERDYLLAAYNHYHSDSEKVDSTCIIGSFAGIRPLLYSASDPSNTTREYAIERNDKLVNVFGGKWTTTLALARNVVKTIGYM